MNINSLFLSMLFTGITVLGVQPTEAQAKTRPPKYLGYKRCRGCHKKQYDSWKDTVMAKAFESLVPGVKTEAKTEAGLDPMKNYMEDPKCLRCHATGHGEPAGFKNITETQDLGGVTCEACHNPGERYYAIMSKKRKTYRFSELLMAGFEKPSKITCDKCHVPGCPTTDDDYEMDFDDTIGHDRFPLKYDH